MSVFSSDDKKIKNFPPALPRITPRSVTGIFLILVTSGCFYVASPAKGEEKVKEDPEVCRIIKTAATSTDMAFALGRAYEKGWCGFEASLPRTLTLYRQAAEHGHMLAAYSLGEIYFSGRTGAADYPAAKTWFLKAAQMGHGPSQLRLGTLCAEAHFDGLEPDMAAAEKWLRAAARQDAGDARFRLGDFYRTYKDPPEPGKAAYWLRRAAEGGHPVAMFELGRLLRKGEGVPADPAQGLVWMIKAGDRGLSSAQMALSEIYETGDGVPKDMRRSLEWTLKVAEAPSAMAYWLNKAGDIFFSGRKGIPKDHVRALIFYRRAAAQNDAHALARLGDMYLKGLGVKKEAAKGRDYLKRAAAMGDPEASGMLPGKKKH